MNKRNVEALTQILSEMKWSDLTSFPQEEDPTDERSVVVNVPLLAHRLAEKTALIPSVITEPQRNFLGQSPAPEIVPRLEKIARGES